MRGHFLDSYFKLLEQFESRKTRSRAISSTGIGFISGNSLFSMFLNKGFIKEFHKSKVVKSLGDYSYYCLTPSGKTLLSKISDVVKEVSE